MALCVWEKTGFLCWISCRWAGGTIQRLQDRQVDEQEGHQVRRWRVVRLQVLGRCGIDAKLYSYSLSLGNLYFSFTAFYTTNVFFGLNRQKKINCILDDKCLCTVVGENCLCILADEKCICTLVGENCLCVRWKMPMHTSWP